MHALAPLTIAVPLLAASVLIAIGRFTPRWFDDIVAIAASAFAVVASAVLLVASDGDTIVSWMGGWEPRDGVAIGIGLVVDPFGAGVALLASVLAVAALVFSLRYFDEADPLYSVLMLVFLAALCGFALAGDLFTMFVLFELMGAAAYALTGFRIEERAPIQGALNFAITNSIGAFLLLLGIGLVYARTGALNLAQLGRALESGPADAVVVVAFALLVCGFLVKAAAVPFHFWLADAHAVAPAPVCAMLSGVMVDVGILGVARVYWTGFDGALGQGDAVVRRTLLAVAVASAVVGAVMCFLQRHLKRMLAYSTIAHGGVVLAGIALLSHDALTGSALYVVSHGLLKGALFLAVGVLLQRLDSVDELHLHGRGRPLRVTAAVFLVCVVGLADVPPFGTFLGHALVEESAKAEGHAWLPWVLSAATAVASAALIRAWARVFVGAGTSADPLLTKLPDEEGLPSAEGPSPWTLVAPAAALAVLGLVLGIMPGVQPAAEQAAARFVDAAGYRAVVLGGASLATPPADLSLLHVHAASLVSGLLTGLAAVALAAAALGRRRFAYRAIRPVWPVLTGARAVHSGRVGDYVAWLLAGTAAIGGALALALP
jgi:multicomponent Na+:H+ antiporter subunit D